MHPGVPRVEIESTERDTPFVGERSDLYASLPLVSYCRDMQTLLPHVNDPLLCKLGARYTVCTCIYMKMHIV